MIYNCFQAIKKQSLLATLCAILLISCGQGQEDFFGTIPFRGEPIDLLVEDLDRDGRKDVIMTSHAMNMSRVAYQKKPRSFSEGVDIKEVGFHPSLMMRWPVEPPQFLESGEGANALYSFTVDEALGLKRQATLSLKAPVEAILFRWPEWGPGLAVSSFKDDKITFFNEMKPDSLEYKDRKEFRISQGDGPSFLAVGRIKALDADRDGWDEIYYPVGTLRQVRRIRHQAGDFPKKSELVAEITQGIPDEILAADLNHDGSPDLLVPDMVPGGWMHILMNDGAGVFKEVDFPNLAPNSELRSFSIRENQDTSHTLLIAGVTAVHLLTFPSSWAQGQPVELISVTRAFPEVTQAAVLEDIDGDGQVDALIGLDRAESTEGEGVRIIYGPLREHLSQMAQKKMVFK